MSSDSAPAESRRPWRPFAILAAGLLVLGFATWEPMPVGVWHDDGVYVMLGQSLAQGTGLRYHGVSAAPPATKFPPLYPLIVAGVWRLAPEFPDNVKVMSALNLVFLAMAGGLFATLCHSVVGLPLTLSLATAGAAWTSLELWRVAAIPLSEASFLLVLLASLFLGTRAEKSGGRLSWIAFLFGFAAVFHVRTVGAVVGAAIVLAALTRRRWRLALALAAGVVVVMLPWTWWSSTNTAAIAAPLRDILGSYGAWLGARVGADPAAFLLGLPAGLVRLGDWCLTVLLPGAPPAARAVSGTILVPLLIVGLADLIRRTRLVGLTVVMLLLALWIWPFLDRRLMAPQVPWLVLALVLGTGAAARHLGTAGAEGTLALRRADGRPEPAALPVAALTVWALYFVAISGLGLLQGRHEAGYRVRAQALGSAVDAVARSTPEGAVIGAPELWAGINLYTGRRVAPSAPFRPGDEPVWGSPREQLRLWETVGLDHVLVEHGGRVHGAAMDLLDAACPGGAVAIVASYDGAFLVRLGWDEACRRSVLGD